MYQADDPIPMGTRVEPWGKVMGVRTLPTDGTREYFMVGAKGKAELVPECDVRKAMGES